MDHVIVLSYLHHRSHIIRSVLIVQYCILLRSHLYDRSYHYLISSSSCSAHSPISLDSSVLYSMEITPIRSVKLLCYLLFMIDHILSDRLSQFSFDFDVDRTYTINHVVILSCLRHRSYPVDLVITVQFHFRRRVDLYNRSCRHLVSFSSQTSHYPINLKVQYCVLWRSHLYNQSHRFLIYFS